jgi:outer membrane PBP1 activator LpoA protein
MNCPTHPAREGRLLASAVLLLIATLALGGCETTPFGALRGGSEAQAVRLAAAGQHAQAAGAYIALAGDAIDSERDRLTLLAVEQWLDAGDVERARNAFGDVERPTGGELITLWRTNWAAFSLYDGQADAALRLLEPMSREALSRRDRLRVEALRADAWFQKQDPARAVQLMIQRESWIDDDQSVEQSRRRLWQGLLVSNSAALRSATDKTLDPIVRGWLIVGLLAKSTGQQGAGWAGGVQRWQAANPEHPAIAFLGELSAADPTLTEYPSRIALLLPLTGQAGRAGHAVQNGFLGAYFASAGGLDDRQSVRIYDVNAEGGATAAYTAAVDEGAEFVIGPLLKSSVLELANDIIPPVPVLILNYLPEDTLVPPGLFQFALAPEDEAASAAVRALDDGHTRAVALVPNNDWGRRVLTSFATEFEGLGGTLLDYRSFQLGVQDFSNDIEGLMGLTGSVQRYQRMRANLDVPLQFDPRRRQDAEFVFVATNAATARLLKSQLKFHYAGDLPVYSTSSVNSMDGRSNTDLNGIMFADAPWVIDPQPWIENLPEQYAEFWPDERRLARLHAMGYDAYNLIAALYSTRGLDIADLDGASGRLSLDAAGKVRRELAWAQFQNNTIVALPANERPGGPIQDRTDDSEPLLPKDADDAPWDTTHQEL